MYLGIMISLIVGMVPIVVITIIITAIVRSKKEGISESFEKIVRLIYVYVLLIAFLFMMVGSVVYAFESAVNYYLPDNQINEASDVSSSVYPNYYSDELTKLQNDMRIKSEKNASITDFSCAISMLVVSIPLFLYHSKLAKKLKED